ncbi:MAG: ATP-binding protein [bacterium]
MKYKTKFFFSRGVPFFTLVILIISGSFADTKEKFPLKLTPVYETNADYMLPADIDGDGIDELIECKDNYCFVKTQTGNFIMQYTASAGARVEPVGAFQLDTKTKTKEIVLSVTCKDTVQLCIISKGSTPHRYNAYVGKDLRNAGIIGYDSGIPYAISTDVNGDGNEDLICFALTGFDLFPRGVFVYDYKNNRELWHYWMGALPHRAVPFLGDIDNDQKKEIVFGTVAVSNGAILNGTDDEHTWVIVLGLDGTLKWKKQMYGIFSCAALSVVDIDRDGDTEIVVCETQGTGDKKEPNLLSILNGRTGELKKYIRTGEKFLGMGICDYNRDGNLDIITGNSDGVLRMFNANLELLASTRFPTGVHFFSCIDLDHNGTYELLVKTADAKLTILNEQLEIMGYTQLNTGVNDINFSLARNVNQYNIIAIRDKHNIVLYRADYCPMLTSKFSNRMLLLLLLLSFIAITYLLAAMTRHKRIVHMIADNAPIAYLVLNKKNRPIYVNHKCMALFEGSMENLELLLKDPLVVDKLKLKTQTKIPDIMFADKKLEITFYPIAGLNFVTLVDKTMKAFSEEIISWAGFAQKLAHEIKNPLSIINLTVQRIQRIGKEKLGKSATSIEKYTNSALEEVVRLREIVDKFMRILSLEKTNIMPVKINELLDRVVNRYELNKPRGIKLQKIYTLDLPAIFCDESQISTAFSNIIENAFEAMGNKGILTIKTSSVEAINDSTNMKNIFPKPNTNQTINNNQNIVGNKKIQKFVEVKIEDTGKGMSAEELNNLYKPFWSTKKSGTGLGLVIAFRIIDMHKGKIEITSKKDIGTVVTVLLPIQPERSNE